MESYVIPLYIFSGILMLIGVYLTIKYRPYCTFKSPERELAMELHRKKLMKEKMNLEEQGKISVYERETVLYSFGNFLLFFGVLIHGITFLGIPWSSFFYNLSILLMIPLFIRSGRLIFPYCVDNFMAFMLWNYKEIFLSGINIYQKKSNGVKLTDDESNEYMHDRFNMKVFELYRYSINIGVILFLVLDLLFSLNNLI